VTRTDEDLIHAVQGGDLDSLGVLVARWEQPLFRFAFRLLRTREDARDVCQETFLRVLHNAERFRDGARVSTWLYQIALNLCRDHARKRRRWSAIIDDRRDARNADPVVSAVDAAADPSAGIEKHERRRAVARALAEIPPEQREVLILKEFEGLKFREIAEILRCPESTVKSRMYYGLAGLKTALSRNGVRGA
jgi:RNA polymerase sigma-70 factor (ECF subfamily)